MTIDRRRLLAAGAGAGVAAMTGFDAFAQPEKFADLYAKAKPEGELTWYVAHYRTETAEAVGKLFTETYPGIKVNVVRATGQVIFQRLSQDIKVKARNCDVFSTSDQSHNIALRKMNMLTPYKPRTLSEIEPLVRANAEKDGYWTATDCSMLIMLYSTKAIPAAEAPKKWLDLIDPKWAGQVALGHPGYSGSMGAWVVQMTNMYKWDFFEKLAKNKPHISRSLADPPTTISSGERKLGIGPAGMTAGMIARNIPLAVVLPEEGVQLGFGPTALIANAPHPNAAKLFLEFQLSKAVTEIMADLWALPIRPDVQPKPGSWKAGAIKGFRTPASEVEAKLPELIEKWRDTFGV